MNNLELALQFFLQLAVILSFCRMMGAIAIRLGQPQVVAEMVAGVMLGPSLFGVLWIEGQQALFPWDATQTTRDTQSYLYPLSQLGLALYMFVVGMEFRIDIIRRNVKACVAVSLAGMIVPFTLGAGLAWLLFHHTNLFPVKTGINEAMLFLGASMCITAFPMLARIIHFKKLTGTNLGTIALGAGAIDDITAWSLLAVILAIIEDDPNRAIWNIAGGIVMVMIAVLLVRPILLRLERHLIAAVSPIPAQVRPASDHEFALTETGHVVSVVLMLLGAWFTDYLGLHAVFGAFVIGAVMPRGVVTRDLIARIQPLTIGLLLPLFFTYSGLHTQIGLLDSAMLWGVCGVVLLAAVLGKGGACWLAARWAGLRNREAFGVGLLMNVRGMMELIIINIGLQRGLISEELFAILVIMAIVTTLMAAPIFDRLKIGKQESASSTT
ncbi:MAG: cation:proton antiporter [Planctomycetaceae bacterium]